jgi:hypothetical protein
MCGKGAMTYMKSYIFVFGFFCCFFVCNDLFGALVF